MERVNRRLTLTANVGVVAGLVLVAYEINQTQRQLEIAALADSTDNFTQAMETLSKNRDFSELIFIAETKYDELDELEKWRVFEYLDGFMTMSEQDFQVLKDIEAGTLGGFEYDWKHFMKQSHYRAYWSANEDRFGLEFRAFVNGLLADQG